MSWTALKQADLAEARRERAQWLRSQLANMPKIEGPDYAGSRSSHHKAVVELAWAIKETDPAAKLRDEWNGASVWMLGLRSTSTSGLHGALTNWCARIEKDYGGA